jgi:hypothetical protein
VAEAAARYSGGCLCGAVRYEVHGPLRDVVNCHCSQCRRTTGHFLAATATLLANLKLREERGLRWYDASPDARRGFCNQCGSTLFWRAHARDYVSIAAGTLDDASGLKTVMNIFTVDKGAYYDIPPGSPQIPDGNFSVPIPKA